MSWQSNTIEQYLLDVAIPKILNSLYKEMTPLTYAYKFQPKVVKYLLESDKCDTIISTIDLNNKKYFEKSIKHIKNYKI
jgi:hypothetical protein